MASYQVHLRPIVDWDAKPLPPLPLDLGRSHRPYKPATNNDSKRSQVEAHRRGNVFPPELDLKKFQGVDSRVVEDKPRRTRPNHHPSPSMASSQESHLQMRNEWDAVLDKFQHPRQRSDEPKSRSARREPSPAITTVEDLSLPRKVRQIIGVEIPRNAKKAQWNSNLTQATPSAMATARPISTTSAYSQASGHRQEMLFHMEDIVEELEKVEDEEEIHRRLESLVQSPGFAAIRCFPDKPTLKSRFSLDAAHSRQDEPRQRTSMDYPEHPPQDRSSREMYHDLVIELAQSAPTALPPPPKPPVELDDRHSGPSFSHHRRHNSSPSNETGQPRHEDGHTSGPRLGRRTPKSTPGHISVFDHDSSDSEPDSDSKPLWSPKLSFLGRRRR
ncbi:hypothetical protein KVR01_005673 [Diaporthe batatas]|uniref:uncharacterized protein n=1 Tax=Diaporthe batatas TaxID=748121 RepID=UPI001D046B5C|nr:uncharacterized protein KVR01_005673 [Diaporthe batatas]KAG8165398.1 hypothetical protein KVR01_005673 [Diaporthe batatas]